MFFDPQSVEDALKCAYCRDKFTGRVKSVPCGKSICHYCYDELKGCLNKLRQFKCRACKQKHDLPKSGLPINSVAMEILKMQPKEVAMTEEERSLKQMLGSLEEKAGKVEMFSEQEEIETFCEDLKEEISLKVQSNIKHLEDLEQESFKKINKFCQERLEALTVPEHRERLAATKQESAQLTTKIGKLCASWANHFCQVGRVVKENQIQAALQSAEYFLSNIKLLEDKLRKDAFNDSFLEFVENRHFSELNDHIGELVPHRSTDEDIEDKLTSSTISDESPGPLAELKELTARKDIVSFQEVIKIYRQPEATEKLDICFLISWEDRKFIINKTELFNQMIESHREKDEFKHMVLRFALVGYEKRMLHIFDFVEEGFNSADEEVNHVTSRDESEAVINSLDEALKLKWKESSTFGLILHVGKEPCYDVVCRKNDLSPSPQEEESKTKLISVLKILIERKIRYYFADSVHRSIQAFSETVFVEKLKPVDQLLKTILSVANSVTDDYWFKTKYPEPSVSIIFKQERQISQLDWDIENFQKLNVLLYKPRCDFELNRIERGSFVLDRTETSIHLSRSPFTKSDTKLVRAAYMLEPNGKTKKKYVVKEMRFRKAKIESNSSDQDLDLPKHFQDSIEYKVVSAFLARRFDEESSYKKLFRFLDINLIKFNSEYFILEEYVEDKPLAISPKTCVNEGALYNVLDVFTHWAYEATDRRLLITRMEGVPIINSNSYLLTNSDVLWLDNDVTFDIGQRKVRKFFDAHACERACKKLNLPVPKRKASPEPPNQFKRVNFKVN